MKKNRKIKKMEIGDEGYLNLDCWLVKSLGYPPYNRCRYCEFKFRKCLFLHYQIISLVMVGAFLSVFYLIEGRVSGLLLICLFSFVIVYGYVLNKSMDKVIRAIFAQRKASRALKELTLKLEDKVEEQTEDIRKKAEELEQKNSSLSKLLKMKDDFLHVVNHQLNTPLSIIKNSCYMIKSGDFTLEKGLEFIDDGVKRLHEICNDFWKAFSIEGEGVKLNLEETNLEEMLDKLVESEKNSPSVKEKGLEVKINKNISIPKVKSDPKQLIQVATNLLENAISYTRAGAVTVYFEKPNEELFKVLIEDSGCGIDEEDQGKIFEKFIRGKRGVSERPSGSGLGLYIAKRIVEAGGGEMKLEKTEVDKGSTFSFTVPVWK